MRYRIIFRHPLLFLLFFIFCSCNRYIDVVKEIKSTPIEQGYFNFYPDSNILVYKTKIILTRDTEKLHPKAFKLKLPKGLTFFESTGSSDFSFNYKKNQVVFIRVDLENNNLNQDTSYSPKEEELNKFIGSIITKSKYNINKIPFNPKRNQVFIKKGSATILLYNIEPKNYDMLYKFVNEFSFI